MTSSADVEARESSSVEEARESSSVVESRESSLEKECGKDELSSKKQTPIITPLFSKIADKIANGIDTVYRKRRLFNKDKIKALLILTRWLNLKIH